ncbi:MAG: SPFH domain-containing protein [Acidimicrobiia bacterium]
MADVNRYPFRNHLRSGPTGYVRYQRKGKEARAGVGQAFWYRPLTAAISELPVDDRELPVVFHCRTKNFQDVVVQANVTYRIADPATAVTRVDFGIDVETGAWVGQPLDQIGGLLTGLAQQHALDLVAELDLVEALTVGVPRLRARVAEGLGNDARLRETGVEVVGVRVVAVRAETDVERALQTPTREAVQQDADRATFERRATAVENERAIAENELQNQIALAKREEELVAQRGQNEQRRATDDAAAAQIRTEAEAGRKRVLADANADTERTMAAANAEKARVVGLAEAEAETAKLEAYKVLDPNALLMLALRELAQQMPNIGTLNLTPDLLTPVLARLGATPPVPAESAPARDATTEGAWMEAFTETTDAEAAGAAEHDDAQ